LLRKQIFNTLENIFVKHGASTIDTPVFELKEILAGKWVTSGMTGMEVSDS